MDMQSDTSANLVANIMSTEFSTENQKDEVVGTIKRDTDCLELLETQENGQDTHKEADQGNESEQLYSYINLDYTTEVFKIEVRNLPRRTDHQAFHAFLRKNNIKFRKAKVIQANSRKSEKTSHAYVTLKSQEDRQESMTKLSGIKFKGCELTVGEANPLPDPLLMKRRDNSSRNGSTHKRPKLSNDDGEGSISKATIDDNFDNLPEEKRNDIINTQVASLWKVPYEEQLTQKAALLQKVMKNCFYDFLKICKTLPKDNPNRIAVEPTLNFFGSIKIADSIVHSPIVDGYRNKCEFNVGADRTVGFRLGLYKEGTMRVISPPANCPIISSQMHQVVSHFQSYLKESQLDGFNPLTHEGHWRQIMVRTTRSGQCLVSIALHRQELSDEQIQKDIIESIREHFANNVCGVCSIYVQVINDRTSQVQKAEPQFVSGETHIYEQLTSDSLRFRISPLSFFQINTDAAELLYSKIALLAACKPDTTIVDVCSGTGTISICVARSVRKVIGIEFCADAILDARFNAELNSISNIEFHCGRAEQMIGKILDKLGPDDTDVVAILDPPRSGLAASLIKAIRNNNKISRLVYVSCEANSARRNFIDLCRPQSNAYSGRPFVPKSAIPVDLFPCTERCELILLFERV